MMIEVSLMMSVKRLLVFLFPELNENKTNEDELAAEKKKTLNVVQSVLNINLNNPTSKGSVTAKKFKYG